jgi:hypothetical protein
MIGGLLGILAVPAFAGATTYAIGKVFIRHFESGGTFLDFDPSKAKAYFQQQFKKAKSEQPAPAPAAV